MQAAKPPKSPSATLGECICIGAEEEDCSGGPTAQHNNTLPCQHAHIVPRCG